jgi:hypothetical protein
MEDVFRTQMQTRGITAHQRHRFSPNLVTSAGKTSHGGHGRAPTSSCQLAFSASLMACQQCLPQLTFLLLATLPSGSSLRRTKKSFVSSTYILHPCPLDHPRGSARRWAATLLASSPSATPLALRFGQRPSPASGAAIEHQCHLTTLSFGQRQALCTRAVPWVSPNPSLQRTTPGRSPGCCR